VYYEDTSDVSKFATDPNMPTPLMGVTPFTQQIAIADIQAGCYVSLCFSYALLNWNFLLRLIARRPVESTLHAERGHKSRPAIANPA
jgi:hypothetical protein